MKKKKTVAYLTRHAVSNYGSVLQAYATQTALEKLGANAVCIDYYRTDEKTENLVDTRLKSVSAKWNKNALTRLVFKATQNPVYKFADKRFAEYRKIVKVTDKEYNSEQELAADIPQADIYMTGSDQVWKDRKARQGRKRPCARTVPKAGKKKAVPSDSGQDTMPRDSCGSRRGECRVIKSGGAESSAAQKEAVFR